MVVEVPVGAPAKDTLTLTTTDGAFTTSTKFTRQDPPTITAMTPGAAVGAVMTIAGTGLGSATTVRFSGGVTGPVGIRAGGTLIASIVPAGAITGPVSVTTSTGTTPFIVLPKIDSFTPASGLVGSSVTITGTNLTGATVRFGLIAAAVTSGSDTSLVVVVPAGAISREFIYVTTPDGTAQSPARFTLENR